MEEIFPEPALEGFRQVEVTPPRRVDTGDEAALPQNEETPSRRRSTRRMSKLEDQVDKRPVEPAIGRERAAKRGTMAAGRTRARGAKYANAPLKAEASKLQGLTKKSSSRKKNLS